MPRDRPSKGAPVPRPKKKGSHREIEPDRPSRGGRRADDSFSESGGDSYDEEDCGDNDGSFDSQDDGDEEFLDDSGAPRRTADGGEHAEAPPTFLQRFVGMRCFITLGVIWMLIIFSVVVVKLKNKKGYHPTSGLLRDQPDLLATARIMLSPPPPESMPFPPPPPRPPPRPPPAPHPRYPPLPPRPSPPPTTARRECCLCSAPLLLSSAAQLSCSAAYIWCIYVELGAKDPDS